MAPRLSLPLLAAALLALPGCFYGPTWGAGGASDSSDAAMAQANVRASIPALEAYWAENGTYAGATAEGLRSTYDAGIPAVRLVGPLNRRTYCVESTVGSSSYSKRGPAGYIVPGGC